MIFRKSFGIYKGHKIEYSKKVDGCWKAESTEYPDCIVYGETKAGVTKKLVELIEEVEKRFKE